MEDRLLPALAVTEGVGVGEELGQMILLITWLLESATYMSPELSAVIPVGLLKEARVLMPSVLPATELPANVEVCPLLGKMARMRWSLLSATRTRPKTSTASW